VPYRGLAVPGLGDRRKHRGLTQQELGLLAGVNRVTVARLEAGDRGAPPTVARLAKALKVPPLALSEPEAFAAEAEVRARRRAEGKPLPAAVGAVHP
jgi:transcriptional regulator with XRE-family HTH domain